MNQEQFIIEISEKMRNKMCDLFVGSGISAPSGLPTWRDFLDPHLSSIGIHQKDEDNLPLMAQYIVNSNIGNRNVISDAVFNTFGKEYPLNEYHRVISNYPVRTVWTTNYDCLLEQSFSDRKPRVIKMENDLLHPCGSTDVEIIKLHGCARSAAQGIVLTRADYDCFLDDKPKLSQRLREAFINQSLFFVGYSYQDPNVQTIMTQAYQMSGRVSTNTHYILLSDLERKKDERDEEFEQRKLRFELWISELNRIGIRELVVPQEKVVSILKSIDKCSRGKSVFVTGGHQIDDQTKAYATVIGTKLAEMDGVILNNGQSQGIGDTVLFAFMQKLFDSKQDMNERVRIFPNPYSITPEYADDPSLLPDLKKARVPLVTESAVLIAFPGNIGTAAEIELARSKARLVFPIICDEKSYTELSVIKILSDNTNMNALKNIIPEYCEKLERKEVPNQEVTIAAMEYIINGKIHDTAK